jgi:hypothetical protein
MSSADRTSSGRTQRLKAITLAVYHDANAPLNDYGGVKPSNAATLLRREVGQRIVCVTCIDTCVSVCDFSGALVFPFLVSEIPDIESDLSELTGQVIVIPGPPEGFPEDRYVFFYYFPEICNATLYTNQIVYNSENLSQQQYFLGMYDTLDGPAERIGFIIAYPLVDLPEDSITFIVSASNECSSSTVEATFGCFLEGAPVAMADGTFKAIEAVEVGDKVRGAFGEENIVSALHHPVLGSGSVININGEHKTTAHHPHVSPDRQFYCGEPNILNNFTYGKDHVVIIDNTGKTEKRKMAGLRRDRIKKLTVGVELQTLTGPRRVDTIESIKMSAFTQVYHLAVSGSHTFVVNGYAVTGWADETDFDYDTWSSR